MFLECFEHDALRIVARARTFKSVRGQEKFACDLRDLSDFSSVAAEECVDAYVPAITPYPLSP